MPDDAWQNKREVLNTLKNWSVDNAEVALSWYLRDKKFKRLGARTLRVSAILLTGAGGLVPIIGGVYEGIQVEWGYVLLALAATCLGFDKFFGLSSGWLRDMQTAQALQQRLSTFYSDWIVIMAGRAHVEPADEQADAAAVLALSSFMRDVGNLVSGETSSWVTEFRAATKGLDKEAGAISSSGVDASQPYVR
ncbi:SLATT domain-containing protein [Actinoplanes sp. TRM 88003]|uniref:SLATT domain-containing protein n=1 Tax=Paractinoplanes aksuensis TaxID=2939490 RepID=A0ABT1DVE9_9ACTN|nr:SLATT domain-containing protein [Actinoplanes aksuensis]MCO8274832.1 SLATT domain-containing protein [Actinoplanes aksuensis]